MAKIKPSFEDSMRRLEEIVAALESSEITLEESMALYREGSACASLCRKQLLQARHELEVWQDGENGEDAQ